MKSALVTGGAGFIGSHLVRRLAREGVNVHLVVRPQSDLSRLAPIRDSVVVHAPTDGTGLADAFRVAAPDVVFHLASQTRSAGASPIDDAIGRVAGDLGFMLTVAKAAAEASRPPSAFIRAASLAEYGAAPPPYRETDRLQPLTPYGASMAACSEVLSALSSSLPYRVVQGRLALVYGIKQSTTFLVAQLVESLSAGRRVEIRNPEARRDLLYIDDAVDGLIRLATRDCASGAINICTGVGISMREAAETVLKATGADPRLVRYGEAPVKDGASGLWGAPEHAMRLLGWKSETSFQEGIAKFLALRAADATLRVNAQ